MMDHDPHEQWARAFRASTEADRIRELIGQVYGGSRIRVPRSPASIGIGAAKSGHEVNWPVRPRPPASHMRSEKPGD